MGDFEAFGDLVRDSAPTATSGGSSVLGAASTPSGPAPAGSLPLPLPAPAPPLTGLDLVEAEIDSVLATIRTERDVLADDRFPVDGYVPTRSYGDGEEAVLLGAAHERAHGVVVDTLVGLTADLETLQGVIAEVRQLLTETDRTAADDLTSLLRETEGIDLGEEAYEDAQREHDVADAAEETHGRGAEQRGAPVEAAAERTEETR